jgi:hypothetical protein
VTTLEINPDAVLRAAKEAAVFMTTQLRNSAYASGWPDEVVKSMNVIFNNNRFMVNVPQEHQYAATSYEYGTPDLQPTAVIRNFSNRLDESERFLLLRAKVNLGGKV